MILYDNPGSPCARRVRTTLLAKNLPFTRVNLDLVKMENKADWYLAINPNGQVPALVDGDKVLYESNVITEYLDDVYGEPRLYPTEPRDYARIKMWQYFEMSFSKYYGMLMYKRLVGPIARIQYSTLEKFLAAAGRYTNQPALLGWEEKVYRDEILSASEEQQYIKALWDRLWILEKSLENKDYLVGGGFSQAEVSVYPRVYMYAYIGLDIDPKIYPNVSRWLKQTGDHPAFQKSMTALDRLMGRYPVHRVLNQVDKAIHGDHSSLPFFGKPLLAIIRQVLGVDPNLVNSGFETLINAFHGLGRPLLPKADKKQPSGRVDHNRNSITDHGQRNRPVRTDKTYLHLDNTPVSVLGSIYSLESHILCGLLDKSEVDYDYHEIDSHVYEEYSADFRKLNPNSELPVLTIGQDVYYGWPAVADIVIKLTANKFNLMPTQPYEKARARIWLYGDLVAQYKYIRPLFWQTFIGPRLRQSQEQEWAARARSFGANSEQLAWLKKCAAGTLVSQKERQSILALIERRFNYLESILVNQSYLCGNEPSLADYSEWTRFKVFSVLGSPTAGRPFVQTWVRRIGQQFALPPVLKASPSQTAGSVS